MKKALCFILINLISSLSFAQGGYFIKNNGQYPPQVLFAAKLNYGSFFIEKDGFKIVNQDISLEWLKKNNGLPENMNDLTSAQRSKLGSLQHQARSIAKRKMMKYQGI